MIVIKLLTFVANNIFVSSLWRFRSLVPLMRSYTYWRRVYFY